MAIDYYLLGQFTVELQSINRIEDCFQIYEKYIHQLHFNGVVYSFIPKMTLEKEQSPIFQYSDTYQDFLAHYLAEDFSKQDFTIREIQLNQQLNPMDAWEYERKGMLSKKERSVIEIAREDYGIINTLSIPIMNKEIGIAGVTVFSTEQTALFNKIKAENIETLRILTHQFNEKIIYQSHFFKNFLPPQLLNLTKKEQYILKFIIQGKTMKELPEDYISHRYGEKILGIIRKKFGNISTNQVIYYASKYHLI